MAVLIYRNGNGEHRRFEFHGELKVGSDPANQLALVGVPGVAPHHAIFLRATSNGLPVLVDQAGSGVRVNGLRIVLLKVLRHGDEITIGDAKLTLREMEIRELPSEWAATAGQCPVCQQAFRLGEEIVSCPRCQKIHHRGCWFSIANCSTYACEYRVQETVMKALAKEVKFERGLMKESELVQKFIRCASGNKRDAIPFQEGTNVAYCPNPKCQASFHLTCWIELERCPKCSYPIKRLFNRIFGEEIEAATGRSN